MFPAHRNTILHFRIVRVSYQIQLLGKKTIHPFVSTMSLLLPTASFVLSCLAALGATTATTGGAGSSFLVLRNEAPNVGGDSDALVRQR